MARLGAGVIAANDEFFAERENLLKPEPAEFDPERFVAAVQVLATRFAEPEAAD